MQISLKWIGGATWVLTIDNIKIACDPVLCPKGTIQNYILFRSQRTEDPQYNDRDFADVDLWLITHNHKDHLDKHGKKMLSPQSTIISRGNPLSSLKNFKHAAIFPLTWNKTKSLQIKDFSIKITAIPAIHGTRTIAALLAGRSNGYIVEIKKNETTFTLFITGDGVLNRKTTAIAKKYNIDLLIANTGEARMGSRTLGKIMGPLTLNAAMFQKLVNTLQPKHAVPVHFGTFSHYIEPAEALYNSKNKTVKIINPGETLKFNQTAGG